MGRRAAAGDRVAAQRQAEHRAALPGAAAGAEEDDGCRRAAHAGGGEAPLRAPESRELALAAAGHDAQGREDELAAADPGLAAPHPGDRGADRERLRAQYWRSQWTCRLTARVSPRRMAGGPALRAVLHRAKHGRDGAGVA